MKNIFNLKNFYLASLPITLSFIIAFSLGLQKSKANPIDSTIAKTVAENFYFDHAQVKVMNVTKLAYAEKNAIGDTTVYFIFNINQNDGWVIVSADDATMPILGYSLSGHFDITNQSPELAYWMDCYRRQILFIKANNISAIPDITNKWQEYKNSQNIRIRSTLSTVIVPPLLSTAWDQGGHAGYYNSSCPTDISLPNSSCGNYSTNCVTGCCATAMAQILKYWGDYIGQPTKGIGTTPAYTTSTQGYSIPSQNLGATTFYWSNMPDSLTSTNVEVANLMYDCGVSMEMDYTPCSSGAWMLANDALPPYNHPYCAQNSYTTYFGFNTQTIQGKVRSNFTDQDWISLLENELINNRPVQYGGWESSGEGHIWVCDGYESSGYFHMNWGWGNRHNTNDGYWNLNTLNPSSFNFTEHHEALIGIQPNISCTDNYEPNDNCTNATLVFASPLNSGSSDYTMQGNIGWAGDQDWYRVNIGYAGTLTINLSDIPFDYDLELYGTGCLSEFLDKSYKGGTTPEQVSYTYSGNSTTVYAKVYPKNSANYTTLSCYNIQFVWAPSSVATYCNGTINLTATSATFDDGSGSSNYADNSNCKWLIQPSGATSITLNFSSFAVSNPGDSVYVYDGNTVSAPLLLKWTGSTLPTAVTSTGGSMLVRFATGGNNNAAGWLANYTSTTVTTYCNGTTTLTASSGSFSDGSGTNDYGNYSHCSWLISPLGAHSITLSFSSFSTESTNDIVNIYDGINNSATLLGSISGSSIPSSITSLGGKIFVEFITNSTITSSGWDASYVASIPTYENGGIVGYEYWFDKNYAGVVHVPNNFQQVFHLNTNFNTTGLSAGLHSFNIRFVDYKGNYSSVVNQFFNKLPVSNNYINKIIAYEYWFDNNYSSKVLQTITPQQTYNMISNIPANSLTNGLHSCHFRYLDNAGQWSSVVSEFFQKNGTSASPYNLITAYRYWFDMANNAMVTVNLPTPTNPYQFIKDVCASNLSNNNHTIHFQFKDTLQAWSSVLTDTFYKNATVSPVITKIGSDLGSSSVSGNQWYYNNSIITGATSQTYTPTASGNYYCIVTDVDGCFSDTSNVIYVVITGINNLFNNNCSFEIYPNPANNTITIECTSITEGQTISIYDIHGQLLIQHPILQVKTNISITRLVKGMYYVKVKTEKEVEVKKFIKE